MSKKDLQHFEQLSSSNKNANMLAMEKKIAIMSKRALVYILRANRAKVKFWEHLKIARDHSSHVLGSDGLLELLGSQFYSTFFMLSYFKNNTFLSSLCFHQPRTWSTHGSYKSKSENQPSTTSKETFYTFNTESYTVVSNLSLLLNINVESARDMRAGKMRKKKILLFFFPVRLFVECSC